jgi:hypothetical protein
VGAVRECASSRKVGSTANGNALSIAACSTKTTYSY